MFNNTNGATFAEKLGLDSEVRELKFGSSFTPGNRGQSGAFHSIKYDFKPASVDKSKTATLEMGPSGQVTISMPHYDNTGSTIFKGSTRPYTKECVLIIDKQTGEIVLEKLSHNVQVKKTRQEGSGKNSSKNAGLLGDVEPIPPPGSAPRSSANRTEYTSSSSSRGGREDGIGYPTKRPIPPAAASLNPSIAAGGGGSGVHGRRPNSPLPPTTNSSRHSPLPLPSHHHPSNSGRSLSPSLFETTSGKSGASAAAFDALVSKQSTTNSTPAMLSLTSIEDLLTTTSPQQQQQPPPLLKTSTSSNNNRKEATDQSIVVGPQPGTSAFIKDNKSTIHSASSKKIVSGEMSDSSDDSSSSSSSEDDDDSSSASDMEEVALPQISIDPVPMDISNGKHAHNASPAVRFPPATVPGSMPNFSDLGDIPSHPHLLSEDLQLSESGSDSD